jgi:two-component system, cell cycle sensor histidine kinase and response regulator CckA
VTQTNGTVLVVDDVADARDLVSTILTMGGYDVVEAASGREALQRVEDEPDLIILDVHLPDIDGFEVCRRIKSNPRSATTPIVQISAIFSRTEHRVRGLVGGADAYLTKPFEPDLLVATVNALMRLRLTERQLSRSNRALRLQYELTRVLVEGAMPDVTPRLLATIGDALGAEVAELWRLDETHDEIVRDGVWYSLDVADSAPLERATARLRLPRTTGLPGRAWVAGKVEWLDTLPEGVSVERTEAARALGLRSATVVPVAVQDTVAGAVVLLHRSAVRPPEDVLHLATEVGGRVGLCIERTRNAEALHRAEEQLRQAQKMEAVGRLAGGIAHDFNNLLTVISGHAQLLMDELPGDSSARPEAEAIANATDRAANLTAGLLAFSRKQAANPRVLDLTEVIQAMSGLLRRMVGEDVDITLETAANLGRVRADASHMEQVVMNLAVNARDAMPEGGRLSFALANLEVEASPANPLPPGSYVVLTVADSGVGMDAEVRAHLFEPFFTTKAVGKGTGLGLATVYGIVRQSGGDIRVDSAPGQGTTFRIFLPRVDEPVETTPERAPSPLLPGGTETILLVEDDDAVRQLAVIVLRRLGYTVLEAADAEVATRIFESQAEPIDLLVTDVIMPGLSGFRLAERLRALRPELRVLYLSGYSEEELDLTQDVGADTRFLAKPYLGTTLARTIREVLET